MRVMVTGSKGQVARELLMQAPSKWEIIAYSKEQLDITDIAKVQSVVKKVNPDVIIHPAALTDVDYCEQNPFKAYEVNTVATYALAKVSEDVGARFLFISTDYVFSGREKHPYQEQDEPAPINLYGKTKYEAEKQIRDMKNVTIIRTSWLFGHDGNNFAKKIIQKAKAGNDLEVISDQVGSPTYVPDLVKAIIALVEAESGIYHIVNDGCCSWFAFAKAIIKEMGMEDKVKAISSKEYSSVAQRPQSSILCNRKAKEKGITLGPWHEAVKRFAKKELAR